MDIDIMTKINSICFSGHRPNRLGGFDVNNPVALWVRDRLRGAIERAVARGIVTFVSGGALGVDQWAADIVIELRREQEKRSPIGHRTIELIIARPFPSQPKRWPTEARRHYEKILQQADRIVETSNDPYAARKIQKRNEWMVDNTDAVIAVWD
jgi:uncharacterized phage-like protein YoqJ